MILAILQARCSSSRFAGKVLKPLLRQPMILRQIERLLRCQAFDRLVVATSDDTSDDPLYEVCSSRGLACFRGALDDVLDRYRQCARQFQARQIVRLTADCPLADPDIIDRLIEFHLEGDYDYSSNALERSFPDGLDAEIMQADVLETAWNQAILDYDREHVTPYIYQHRDQFNCGSFSANPDWSGLHWAVDEPEDYEFVQQVYQHLYPETNDFKMHDVLELIAANPQLQEINNGFRRNSDALKSMLARQFDTRQEL